MSRSVPWRREVSEACNWHQSQALDSTIYILRQTGPTGFLLKEDGERKNVKVFMGDPHSCTCPVFKKERDLCKHICWLLLRKFRLSVNDPLSWQLGLVEREINEILRGRITAERPQRVSQIKKSTTNQVIDGRTVVEQREISEEDVCPICQEELLAKKLPVTYCKFACGNTIHIKCMQVWAEHQKKTSPESVIKCPMCREDFGPIDLLKAESRNAGVKATPPPGIRMDRHIGVMCSNCSKAPIEGKCYRCTVCPTYHLCQRCFNFPIHTTHAFQFRQKRNQRWRSAPRTLGSSLPDALVNDLMRREITEDDYDLLLQMERNEQEEFSQLTEDDLSCLPLERVREGGQLLSIGVQCRICLRGFSVGQTVRKLPCRHKFHKDCVDSWLLHSHSTCPIDGLPVFTPSNADTQTASVQSHQSVFANGQPAGSAVSDRANLTLTATGIPISVSRAQGQDVLVASTRRSRYPRSGAHQSLVTQGSDPGLELLGIRVSQRSDLSNASEAVGEADLGSAISAPGGRLLQQASQHRRRVTGRLRANHVPPMSPSQGRFPTLQGAAASEAAGDAGESSITPATLVNYLQSNALFGNLEEGGDVGHVRRTSLGSRGSILSENDAATVNSWEERTRRRYGESNRANQRPRSNDRHASSAFTPPSRKELQEIFLGNHPQSQPAVTQDACFRRPPQAPTSRTRLFRSVFHQNSNPSIQSHTPVEANIHLEGSRFATNKDS